MAERNGTANTRCLIVERHAWETGAAAHQLQIPLAPANEFFGPNERSIRFRLATASRTVQQCSISRMYQGQGGRRGSSTRRINQFPWIGLMGHCFMFIQETGQPDLYDTWVQYDMPIVVASFTGWEQAPVGGSGRGSRGSRGRLFNIVDGPVEIGIVRIR